MSETNGRNGYGKAVLNVFGGVALLVVGAVAVNFWNRLEDLERREAAGSGRIEVAHAWRADDRKLLDEVRTEQTRQGQLLAAIAARLGVEEPR